MIILLEHPPINYELTAKIEESLESHEFKNVHLVSEFLNTNLKYESDAEFFKRYFNYLAGFIMHHYKVPSNYNIVLHNSFAYVRWMMARANVDPDLIKTSIKDVTGIPSFSNIQTIFVVPLFNEDDNIDLDEFHSQMKLQHEFILKNYMDLSDSRRKNKNYHLMAHEDNDSLLSDLGLILSKYRP